eukprot:NODE_353_length_10269_cov_0.284759.p5 type:complete len:218 gc:universal NODE_353_length_10269_cov_0.284759:573-1226(+)
MSQLISPSLKFVFNPVNSVNIYLNVQYSSGNYFLSDNNQVDFIFDDRKELLKTLLLLIQNLSNYTTQNQKAMCKVYLVLPRDKLEDGLRFYDPYISALLNTFNSPPADGQIASYVSYLNDLPNTLPKYSPSGLYFKSVSEYDLCFIAFSTQTSFKIQTVVDIQSTFYVLDMVFNSQKFNLKAVGEVQFNIYNNTSLMLRCMLPLNECEILSLKMKTT